MTLGLQLEIIVAIDPSVGLFFLKKKNANILENLEPASLIFLLDELLSIIKIVHYISVNSVINYEIKSIIYWRFAFT